MKIRLMAALLAGTAFFAAQANAEPVKIGIANFGPHPVLDSVVKGFKDGMTKRGYVEGKNVVYNYTHASFKPNLLPQALAKIQAGKPKLVVTVTTPVSQAGKKMFAGIPYRDEFVKLPVAIRSIPGMTTSIKMPICISFKPCYPSLKKTNRLILSRFVLSSKN